jgi:hypothetical protein
MRKAFAGLAILLMLVVVAQFFLAATGAFNAAPNDEAFRAHRAMGYVAFLLPVAMTIVAALARMPGRLVGLAALVAGLVVVQVVIAKLAEASGDSSTAGQLIFGLHGVTGLVILAVAGMIIRQALALTRSVAPARRAEALADAGASGPVAGPQSAGNAPHGRDPGDGMLANVITAVLRELRTPSEFRALPDADRDSAGG